MSNKHQLYAALLAHAQESSSLAEAEEDLKLLHSVLAARLATRGIIPTDDNVYEELKHMLNEPAKGKEHQREEI